MDEVSLVKLCQAGDNDAFSELYQLYKNPALRSAFLLTGNYCDSENVLQDSFIKCYQNLPKLKEPATFRAWFYRILTRTAWEYCKKRDRESPAEKIFDAYQASLPLEKSSLEILAESEEQETLWAAVNRLPIKQKTVIILYYYNELSVEEIAKATGTLTGTVKSRLFTARQNLQKALAANDANPKEVCKNELRSQI